MCVRMCVRNDAQRGRAECVGERLCAKEQRALCVYLVCTYAERMRVVGV